MGEAEAEAGSLVAQLMLGGSTVSRPIKVDFQQRWSSIGGSSPARAGIAFNKVWHLSYSLSEAACLEWPHQFKREIIMKSILLATAAVLAAVSAASAADLAARPYTKAPPPVMAPSWNWSGFYIGGNVGYGISQSATTNSLLDPTTTPPTTLISTSGNASADGVVGGGQIGWNMMFAPTWLLGVEADIQGANQRGRSTTDLSGFFGPGSFTAVDSRLNWFGTVRGRLGWTATPETLLYVTGGYAYGQVETRNSSSIPNFFAGGNILQGSRASGIKDGWTVGGGIETRLWNSNWTAKAEYLYMDLGNQGTRNVVGVVPFTLNHASNVDFKDHIVRVGLNYKLGLY